MRSIFILIAVGSTLSTMSAGMCQAPMSARFPENPLISVATSKLLGDNTNGPSVLRVPPWVKQPLGRYYMGTSNNDEFFVELIAGASATVVLPHNLS